MNYIINPSWAYRYIGPNADLKNKTCYGCRSLRPGGRRVWSGGPGPRNALVWFPHLPGGFVTVPGRTLRKVKNDG